MKIKHYNPFWGIEYESFSRAKQSARAKKLAALAKKQKKESKKEVVAA